MRKNTGDQNHISKGARLAAIQNDNSGRVKQVCYFYRYGTCWYGSSGKTAVNGKTCSHYHPQKCKRYCNYGYDRIRGCTRSCKLLHPVMCRSSLNFGECNDPKCQLQHLHGTKRSNKFNRAGLENTAVGSHNNFAPRFSGPRNNNYSHNVNKEFFAPSNDFYHQRPPGNGQKGFNYSNDFPRLPKLDSYDYNNYVKPAPNTSASITDDTLSHIMNTLNDLKQQNIAINRDLSLIKSKVNPNTLASGNGYILQNCSVLAPNMVNPQ